MSPRRLSPEAIAELLKNRGASNAQSDGRILDTDVFIAGSGPVASTYARQIIENHSSAKVMMVEIGKQESPVVGEHHKNSVKFQKDIDAFVNVIKGALQPFSIPPSDTNISTLGGDGWAPGIDQNLIMRGNNPNQDPRLNLKDAAATRTVGGMATHWTCCCPVPHADERRLNPIPSAELDKLLDQAKRLLNVNSDQYDDSIRHTVVKETITKAFPNRGIGNLPLAVKRNTDNPQFVTWTGTNTILGDTVKSPRFSLCTEMRVTKVFKDQGETKKIKAALVRDLRTDTDYLVFAKSFIIACGSICTPQILVNSKIENDNIGYHLSEQSIAFCQIVLNRSIIDGIPKDPRFKERVERHQAKYPNDPLPIPFDDPEPQVLIPYSSEFPHHVQVHRDAFSYGDVGPKADSRVIVDLRFFGKQDIVKDNVVQFGRVGLRGWEPGVTDIYGMPQATFEVKRSRADGERDQKMMEDMCRVANTLGSFLPGSNPQFMEPGLALHITGTTRIGKSSTDSVADPSSKIHGYENIWVGGNGCIPDSTACNPTRTSIAIAIKGAASVIQYLG